MLGSLPKHHLIQHCLNKIVQNEEKKGKFHSETTLHIIIQNH